MPLASSRSAAEKRSESVIAEKKEQQRRNRLSFPNTVPSSTVVNETKAIVSRRRRSSARYQRQSSESSLTVDVATTKENTNANSNANKNLLPPQSPGQGPTPYWKTTEDREMSPRLTRSQRKKSMPNNNHPLQERGGTGTGLMLSFSPPNQEENARREQQALKASEQDRQRRVEEARRNGQLLVFSPSNRDYVAPENETEEMQRKDEEATVQQQSENSKDTSAMTEEEEESKTTYLSAQQAQANEDLANELKRLHAGMDKLLQAKTLSESSDNERLKDADKLVMEAQLLRTETLASANTKLEKTNETLQSDVKTLENKLSSEKEAYLVETTRLQSKLEAASNESVLRLAGLEDARQRLEEQVSALKEDKLDLAKKVTELEQEVTTVKERLAESKAMLEALRRETDSETQALASNHENLQVVNSNLSSELDTVKLARDKLEHKIDEYEAAIDQLENHILPESESQLQEASNQLGLQQEVSDKMEKELLEYKTIVRDLQNEIVELNREREEERQSFQHLNEDSGLAYEKLMTESSEKNRKIDELAKQLGVLQQEIEDERTASEDTAKNLHKVQEDMNQRVRQLNEALEETMTQLEQSEQDKKTLEGKLSDALRQIEDVAAAKADALFKNTKTSNALEHLQGSLTSEQVARQEVEAVAREREQRITDLERQLKCTTQERNEARQNMEGFSEREEELYRKLRESDKIRRDLHSRVMQLMGNIRVYVRVRPPLPGELEEAGRVAEQQQDADSKKRKRDEPNEDHFRFPGIYDRGDKKASNAHGVDDLTKNIIEVTEPQKDRGGLSDRRKKWTFGFDNIFTPDHGQDDVWEATEPLVQSAVDGFDVTIFAYGQTGSGKTYTMLGETGNEGIISRSVKKLFETKRETELLSGGETQVALSVELLEVYNEQVRDLLAPSSGPNGREIPLKVNSKEVVGNVVVATSTEEEVMNVLALAQSRRCVKATSSNSESSRSHMLFTIHFDVTMKDGMQRLGKLNVCDLAGSERLDKSGAHHVGGALLKETKHINKSLSVLSNVIERLQSGSTNVPFRESKLTFLLQNSLGGNSKTLAIVCCNPLQAHYHESLCSLRFAAKVNKVDLKAVANFSC